MLKPGESCVRRARKKQKKNNTLKLSVLLIHVNLPIMLPCMKLMTFISIAT